MQVGAGPWRLHPTGSGTWEGSDWVSWVAKVFTSCPSCPEIWDEPRSAFLIADWLAAFAATSPSFQGEASFCKQGLLPGRSVT